MKKGALVLLCLISWQTACCMHRPSSSALPFDVWALKLDLTYALKEYTRAKNSAKALKIGVATSNSLKIPASSSQKKSLRIKIAYYKKQTRVLEQKIAMTLQTSSAYSENCNSSSYASNTTEKSANAHSSSDSSCLSASS